MSLKLEGKGANLRIAVKILMLIALIGFFCPFVMVSCGNQEVAEITGKEMITAEYAEKAQELGVEIISDVGLTVTLIAGIIGFGCTFIKDAEISNIFSCGSAAIAALFMLLSRYNIENQIKSYKKAVEINFMWGWYAVLIIYLLTVIFSYWNYHMGKEK